MRIGFGFGQMKGFEAVTSCASFCRTFSRTCVPKPLPLANRRLHHLHPPSIALRQPMSATPFPSDESLARIAGATTFKRARAYANSGAVDITQRTDREVLALVTGQDEYQVKVSRLDFEGRSSCTCPAFDRGALCKHVVATAIVARDGAPDIEPEAGPEDGLRDFLARQPAQQLATWLTELAESDPTIAKRLRVYQVRQNPAALRKALAQLLRPPSFLDWRRSRAYAQEL
jgi:uncharacterized Zn finger protein